MFLNDEEHSPVVAKYRHLSKADIQRKHFIMHFSEMTHISEAERTDAICRFSYSTIVIDEQRVVSFLGKL